MKNPWSQGPTLGRPPSGIEYTGSQPAMLPVQAVQTEAIQIQPAQLVTVKLAAALIGLSEKAIRRKIEDKWVEGVHYHRSPDQRIFISLEGVYKWVRRGNK